VQDHDKLELAATGLPMFAFPNGMRLTLADAGQFPLPLFFTFVFTDADGKHFYVACLQFYEPVTEADLQETFRKVHGDDQVRYMLHRPRACLTLLGALPETLSVLRSICPRFGGWCNMIFNGCFAIYA
jgi:hypothetical protein